MSAFTVMYCLVLVSWNLLGEEVGKGTSNREDQVMRLIGIVWHWTAILNTSHQKHRS
jgi:hypothetical protein